MNVGAKLMIGALLVSAFPFQGTGAGRSPTDELAATESGSNAPSLSQEKDKAFVIKASQIGRKEIADARMALQFSTRSDTRKLAAALQRDHTKVSATLQAVVKAKGWNIPEAETVGAAGLRANTFTDEHYLAQQLKANDEAITLFKDESTTGADPDLRKLAGKTVETLQVHRSMIQALLPGSETSRNQSPSTEGVQPRRIQQLPASIQPRPGPQESNRFDLTVLKRRGAGPDSALSFTRIKKGDLTDHSQNGGTSPAWQASIFAWTPASVRRPLIMSVVASSFGRASW